MTRDSAIAQAIAAPDLPLYWQGRANALKIVNSRRDQSDAETAGQIQAYEECAEELRRSLAPAPADQSDAGRNAVIEEEIALKDLPMFWQGRANALAILDSKRAVSDDMTHEAIKIYMECADELRRALPAADREAIREALEQADRYIHQMGIPDQWGRHIMAKLTAALALIGEG